MDWNAALFPDDDDANDDIAAEEEVLVETPEVEKEDQEPELTPEQREAIRQYEAQWMERIRYVVGLSGMEWALDHKRPRVARHASSYSAKNWDKLQRRMANNDQLWFDNNRRWLLSQVTHRHNSVAVPELVYEVSRLLELRPRVRELHSRDEWKPLRRAMLKKAANAMKALYYAYALNAMVLVHLIDSNRDISGNNASLYWNQPKSARAANFNDEHPVPFATGTVVFGSDETRLPVCPICFDPMDDQVEEGSNSNNDRVPIACETSVAQHRLNGSAMHGAHMRCAQKWTLQCGGVDRCAVCRGRFWEGPVAVQPPARPGTPRPTPPSRSPYLPSLRMNYTTANNNEGRHYRARPPPPPPSNHDRDDDVLVRDLIEEELN